MIGRALLGTGALALASAGIALAAGVPVAADDLTLVRIPGAVPEQTCTITAVADAHVDEAQPDTTAGVGPVVEVASGPADRRALVRFDIGSCSIPSGAEVRSAALGMVLTSAPSADRAWKLQRVTDAWSAAAVTWNTAPAVDPAATAAAQTGTAPGVTVTWDVVTDVADVVAGATTDRGWRIADSDETSASTIDGALASSEAAVAAERPTLTIAWFD